MVDVLRELWPAKRSGALLSETRDKLRSALKGSDDRHDAARARNDEQPIGAPRARRRLARGTEGHAFGESDERMLADMRMAREIQLRFLPAIPEKLGGVHMLAEYRPAYEIGGDFYDLIQTDDRRFTVVIGDVSGKGVAAALIMSRIMAEFRRVACRRLPPDAILAEVNQFLVDQGFEEGFITATCLEVDLEARVLSVANAGHIPIFVRRAGGQTWTFGDASGAPLGLVDHEVYRSDRLAFEQGDIVLLVTDGITEALEPEADPSRGVVAGLVAHSDHDIHAVSERVLGSVDGNAQVHGTDDIALFAMQLT